MLFKYLNDNFQGPFDDGFLSEHFKTKFGVDVKIEGDKFLFKYNQIEANWNEEVTHYCRGAILRYTFGIGWVYLSRPWKKFFNLGESRCPINETNFNSFKYTELREKLDGSCIQVWYDDSTLEWNASTLGSISTASVGDNPFTFAELFWRLFQKKNCAYMYTNITYLFEMCTPYNQIVTKYDNPRIVFLGAFDRNTGEKYEYTDNMAFVDTDIPDCVDCEFDTYQALLDYVERESDNPIYGHNPEGFVLYIDGVPVAKIKNSKYKYLHHVMTGDPLHVKKNLVNLFFEEKIDDVWVDLTEEMKQFCEDLKTFYRELNFKISNKLKGLSDLKSDRKTYALAVQSLDENIKLFSGVFFEQFNGEITFKDWLLKKKGNSRIFESYMEVWKKV